MQDETAATPGCLGEPCGAAARGAFLLAKPGIVAATALSGYAGMVLAARGVPPAATAVAGLVSLVFAAAGAAAINGVLDSASDRRMARLEKRVSALAGLGAGRVFTAACALIAASLALSVFRLNPLATALIVAAVLSYTVVYTLWLKRRSPFGAVPGGIPGALPVLIGYAAVADTIRPDALVLFAVMLFWQPAHFWTLALEYRDDYRAAGIPVLPVAMGKRYTQVLIFLYATALIPASLALWMFGGLSSAYAAAALVDGGLFLAACYAFVVRSERYAAAFRVSILYLALLLLAIILDASRLGCR